MKKDIKTLREDIARSITVVRSASDYTQLLITKDGILSIEKIAKELIQLEELEKDIEKLTGLTLEEIKEEARNGGIVPKQEEVDQAYKAGYKTGKEHATRSEKPVVPQYVADHIKKHKNNNLYAFIGNTSFELRHDKNMKKFKNKYGLNRAINRIARARLNGFEVEEAQKYYVINNDNRVMLVRMLDGKTITETDRFKLEDLYDGEKESHQLTEQEIKDYDSRYFAFAKPVEEVEE